MGVGYRASTRNPGGFTLAFALVLSVVFATLLLNVFYYIKSNSRLSLSNIFRLQAMSLAEAGNARAISRMNIKTIPTIPEEEGEDGFGDDDFDDFDDFDDDFDDFDDFDEDFDDEFDDDDEFGDEFDLREVGRYINFYQRKPFYVNVNSGSIVSGGVYAGYIKQQREAIARAQEEGRDISNQLLIEDLYLPLPEVNVERIGTINIPRGTHFKPGLKLILAEKAPVQIKQRNLREEYLNVFEDAVSGLIKSKIYNIEPNFAEAGQTVDILAEGENLEELNPKFSSSDFDIIAVNDAALTADISAKTKPGRYKITWGSDRADFFVIPSFEGGDEPFIESIRAGKEAQFSKINNNEEIKGLVITGSDLGSPENIPVMVPSGKGIEIEIASFTKDKITFNLKAKKVVPGSYTITVFNKGGRSNSWIFNVEEAKGGDQVNPEIGTYSTVITLLEANSLINLPIGEGPTEVEPGGRPSSDDDDDGRTSGGRADSADETEGGIQKVNIQRNFDLLKADLETVWKVETVATVDRTSYKVTSIVRRTVPFAKAAITTNSKISFSGTGNIKIEGLLEAQTFLKEASGIDDRTITVEGRDQEDIDRFPLDEGDQAPQITGEGVIQDLNIENFFDSPAARGFTVGGLVAIEDPNDRSELTDFGIIESLGSNTITIEKPGFKETHFNNDGVIQFIPSIISNFGINKRDSEKYLSPPFSFVKIPRRDTFSFVFSTRLEDIKNWTGSDTTDTEVPLDEFEDFEGYFGLNVVEGTPNFEGLNALAGEGVLIVDTTYGGTVPPGTVKIGGNARLPSIFDGVVFIIGKVEISGNVDIDGALIVHSPEQQPTMKINGSGKISYNEPSVQKSILGIPFTYKPHSLKFEKSKGQEEFLKANEDSRRTKDEES